MAERELPVARKTSGKKLDFHIQMIVFALQDLEAVMCIRQLKWLLEQDHVAAQEVVLIEQVPVQFVEAAELT